MMCARELALALPDEGVDPTVLLTSDGEDAQYLRDNGIPVLLTDRTPLRIPSGLANESVRQLKRQRGIGEVNRLLRKDFTTARKISRILRSNRFDLVHNNNGLRVDRGSVLAAAWHRLPQVTHVRAFEPYLSLIDPAIARFTRFIFISQAIARHCNEKLELSPGEGQLIYDAIDEAYYASGRTRRDDVRARLGIGREQFVVASIGRLVPWKGQDVFISAVTPLVRERESVTAIVVGGVGSASAADYARKLHEMVGSSGVTDRLRMVGFERDVAGILAAADMVVHTSVEPEPFGRVIVEGMAAGKPVIGTDAGGAAEIIEHGVTGLLVPPADAEALRAAIAQILDNQQLAKDLAERGLRTVRERYRLQPQARRIAEFYWELLDGRLGYRRSSGPTVASPPLHSSL